jgi:hypothetical protein
MLRGTLLADMPQAILDMVTSEMLQAEGYETDLIDKRVELVGVQEEIADLEAGIGESEARVEGMTRAAEWFLANGWLPAMAGQAVKLKLPD